MIDGKKAIFNDLLAFMWNKMSVYPQAHLLKAMKNYYDDEIVKKARDILYSKVSSEYIPKRYVYGVSKLAIWSWYDICCPESQQCSAYRS